VTTLSTQVPPASAPSGHDLTRLRTHRFSGYPSCLVPRNHSKPVSPYGVLTLSITIGRESGQESQVNPKCVSPAGVRSTAASTQGKARYPDSLNGYRDSSLADLLWYQK